MYDWQRLVTATQMEIEISGNGAIKRISQLWILQNLGTGCEFVLGARFQLEDVPLINAYSLPGFGVFTKITFHGSAVEKHKPCIHIIAMVASSLDREHGIVAFSRHDLARTRPAYAVTIFSRLSYKLPIFLQAAAVPFVRMFHLGKNAPGRIAFDWIFHFGLPISKTRSEESMAGTGIILPRRTRRTRRKIEEEGGIWKSQNQEKEVQKNARNEKRQKSLLQVSRTRSIHS